MGLFRKKHDDTERLLAMQDQLRAMAERLERSDASKTELEARVERLTTSVTTPPPEPPPEPSPTIDLTPQLEALAAIVEEQRLRLADLALVATDAAEKVAAVDGRVEQIATELTNQLTEIGQELDGVVSKDELDDITSGQRRLANEQARYEIQFREDLAELADRIRRPGNR